MSESFLFTSGILRFGQDLQLIPFAELQLMRESDHELDVYWRLNCSVQSLSTRVSPRAKLQLPVTIFSPLSSSGRSVSCSIMEYHVVSGAKNSPLVLLSAVQQALQPTRCKSCGSQEGRDDRSTWRWFISYDSYNVHWQNIFTAESSLFAISCAKSWESLHILTVCLRLVVLHWFSVLQDIPTSSVIKSVMQFWMPALHKIPSQRWKAHVTSEPAMTLLDQKLFL